MVVAEFQHSFRWFHRSTAAYTGGLTRSIEFNIVPADITAHAGLSGVQATNTGPFGATVGFMDVEVIDGRPGVSPSQNPADWRPQISGRIRRFTLGCHVVRGDMMCWMFFQVWR